MFDYKTIVSSRLKISDKFLDKHGETIHIRLKAAYDELKPGITDSLKTHDIFAINQCVHLATSIALLGSSSSNLQSTINGIKKSNTKLSEDDPTTVVTIATLYYLLTVYMSREDEDIQSIREHFGVVNWKDIVEHIHRRFDNVNWLIGPESMEVLEIEAFPKNGAG